jgi:hypothetical protein
MREVLVGDLVGAYELNFDEIDLVSGGAVSGATAAGLNAMYVAAQGMSAAGQVLIGGAVFTGPGAPEVFAAGAGMYVTASAFIIWYQNFYM